ncbi:hypothetical protein PFFCH_00995 [Plasmodium falciparum FCH/4]|uniref:Uncharacterized protein n=1 Tax=Plasmodium falciparum FCH/4 TaxID=1036724 RepID=A0A024VUJ8_PLAFA|nr:hypothetical protein PFFCH_00995 [Plasmodium falciparum FCH/4]
MSVMSISCMVSMMGIGCMYMCLSFVTDFFIDIIRKQELRKS